MVVVAGCRRSDGGKIPVARLDNSTLNLEEIRSGIDTTQEPSQVQIQQYVQRWLTDELLYREAAERGLDHSQEMNKRVDDIRRRLSINALLEQEIYSQKTSTHTPQEVLSYYDAHKSEFHALSDVALIGFALFPNRDAATDFRNTILKGTTWQAAVNVRASNALVHVDSVYYTQATLQPPELWRVVSSAPNAEPSFPISTPQGYFVLAVWKFVKQGQTPDLSFVEKEIRGRLTVEKRQRAYEQLVQTLRSKHSIEVYTKSGANGGASQHEE
jgi:hypothetical protein